MTERLEVVEAEAAGEVGVLEAFSDFVADDRVKLTDLEVNAISHRSAQGNVCILERDLEVQRVRSHFTLVDDALLVLKNEFNGILECQNVPWFLLIAWLMLLALVLLSSLLCLLLLLLMFDEVVAVVVGVGVVCRCF